ncbi:glutathione S-transferase family protein [Sinorhizobium garamanticum]|uniref:Glutathione S-transferase family protein n=1 Tax=Sinorhizobium garamanticum TaxID=680247 RepID=A0ABY8D615_9HYPH|nr:glutathione S-transferase family protein [Sinorhizobium garamanticum]WEX86309.1 glutathione S-transferase family protein [Sinorhizobium garamanticum]
MKLYYHPLSTYSQKTLIAFHEKGIAFEPELVTLMTPEGRAAYTAIYPLCKIPLLKPSDDWMVPESSIIIEYLEDKFPGTPRLIPVAGGDTTRQVRFMDRMADLYLNDPVRELTLQKVGFRAPDEEAAAVARNTIRVTYDHLDKRLSGQEWLCGEFSMADCAAIPPLFYAQIVAPFADRPHLQRYWERAQRRPSYARVMQEFVPIWEDMQAGSAAAE